MIRELDTNIINLARKNGDIQVLPATVYTPSFGDCTNGGASKGKDSIYVICPGGPYTVSELGERGDPIFAVEKFGNYQCLVQVVVTADGIALRKSCVDMIGPMMGGNYAMGDSRWRAISEYPLPIHDRWETPEQNRALSI